MAKFKVLLFKSIRRKSIDYLEKHGADIVFAPGVESEQICGSVYDVFIIIAGGPACTGR